ncbi:MAG: SH3 domain-containing protein [Flavobacteriales bacterium]
MSLFFINVRTVFLAGILLCTCSLSSFSQSTGLRLSVTISSGNLNIREKADGESKIVGKVSKEKELLFQMEVSGDWLKVRYCEYAENTEGVSCIEGWVNKQYVDCPYFHSTILENYREDDEFGAWIDGANGLLMMLISSKEAYVWHKGKKTLLTSTDDKGQRYSAPGISVEFVMFQTELGYESESGVGFLRVESEGKVEYVFVTGDFGV